MSNTTKKGLFITDDGQNLAFIFILVSSLFLLWGFCNGMIDVMDKHFQEELGLSKSQSAWVQFAHYLGYFLMSMPAGFLASKLGYKGGIITGLLIVAAGGFWFIPATHINGMVHEGTVSATAAFVAFLAGVCLIATGLTFLETIANPYTTVLGAKTYAATRINLAQSCNGVGWILGPIVGSMFFYGKNAAGKSTGSETLYIPYVGVAVVVIGIAAVFYFANVPDVKSKDDYHLEDATPGDFAFHLEPPPFCNGGGRAIPLRRRAGRHFQFLHQLYDRGSSPHSRHLEFGARTASPPVPAGCTTGCKAGLRLAKPASCR